MTAEALSLMTLESNSLSLCSSPSLSAQLSNLAVSIVEIDTLVAPLSSTHCRSIRAPVRGDS